MMRIALIAASLILLTAACSATATTPAPPVPNPPPTSGPISPTSATFTDPFAYCVAVGTIDTPDARYTGTPVPDSVIARYKQAANLQSSTEPLDVLRKTTIWRCMDGKVYACNFGANLPCDSKANTSNRPTAAMTDYCQANPNVDAIPAYVVGHDSIYTWKCVNAVAQVQAQVDQPDAQGYLQHIWYALSPIP